MLLHVVQGIAPNQPIIYLAVEVVAGPLQCLASRLAGFSGVQVRRVKISNKSLTVDLNVRVYVCVRACVRACVRIREPHACGRLVMFEDFG